MRLESWKEIAAYLGRDVTTVQRWEKREGMPVHRHLHDKRGSVYAVPAELDAWRQSRKPHQPEEAEEAPAADTSPVEASPLIRERSFDEDWTESEAELRRFRWLVGMAAVVLVLAVVGFLVARHWSESARPKIRSIAVLPLKNLSGDPSQDYLADGMTDALIGRLAGIRELRVISYTSVMRFKNPQVSVPEIARTLNADAIVEGSVIREGNRIRVTAQLIRGATDEHFWSETYDRELQDVLSRATLRKRSRRKWR